VWCGTASAQNLPHRKQVRQGNEAFAKERYEKSIDTYQQALKYDSILYEARYNVGNAYAKTKRWAEAERELKRALTDTMRTDRELAAAYYNLGYAQFMQDSLHQSLESFRRSLVLNPEDMNAKYNYVYVRTLLEQQQNQQNDQNQNDQNQDNQQNQQNQNNNNQNNQNNDQNNDNKDQNNDNQNDKNDDNKNDQNKDNQNDKQNDDKKDNQNDNQSGSDDKKDDKSDSQPQGGQSPSGMTPEQREQMLDAIQAQEDKTQQKVDDADKKRGILIRGKKNW
jgi:tetratricopeptide (TPR) repeat protein